MGWASAGSRWSSGPNAAATPLPATAIRCHASTSPGAPGPRLLEPFAGSVMNSRRVRIRSRHQVTSLEVDDSGVRVSGQILAADRCASRRTDFARLCRGVQLFSPGRSGGERRDRREL